MCVDANAAARNAAKQRWMEKDARYRSESLKFFNRETTAQRGLALAAKGYSRDISDDYQRALYVQGRARAQYESVYMKYLKGKDNYTEVYESTALDTYDASRVPYLEEDIKTIPVYEKNKNVEITLKSSHPAPATLRALAWEGDFSPMFYRRA